MVIDVRGVSSASELWLAVGDDADGSAFGRAEETGRIAVDGPYNDGFEIHLPRSALLDNDKVALVLDAVTKSSGTSSVDIQRATYVISPDPSALQVVRMAPSALGPGQWVCWGRAGAEGFTIDTGNRRDCDRDGWLADRDPDDADPLAVEPADVNSLSLVKSTLDERTCAIELSGVRYESKLLASKCGDCKAEGAAVLTCLLGSPRARCRVPGDQAEFPLSVLASLPANPQPALFRYQPMNARAYFAQSNRSPSEWRAVFERSGFIPAGAYLLLERSTTPWVAHVVQVEFVNPTDESSCQFEN